MQLKKFKIFPHSVECLTWSTGELEKSVWSLISLNVVSWGVLDERLSNARDSCDEDDLDD